MKLLILSDLHTEFTNNHFPTPQVECDAIVLAGDIGTGLNGIKLANKWHKELGVPIVIINGNHEYYGNSQLKITGDVGVDLFSNMQYWQRANCNNNVHFLENDSVIIGGVRFLGCTLWTNFRTDKNLTQEQEMYQAKNFLNDYRACWYEPGRLLAPKNVLDMHNKSKRWLDRELKKPFDGKTVVVTHHFPVLTGIYPDKNGGFCNKMDGFLKKHSDVIELWISGHTHYCLNTEVNGVRIVSNQYGYQHAQVDGFNYNLIEI